MGKGPTVSELLRREYAEIPPSERPYLGTPEWNTWLHQFRDRRPLKVLRETKNLENTALVVLRSLMPKKEERLQREADRILAIRNEEERKRIEEAEKRSASMGKAEFLAQALVGTEITNRHILIKACESVLSVFHGIGCESIFVLFLDRRSACVHVETRFGDYYSVSFPATEIAQIATKVGAKKVVLAHNHPNECPTPSDMDVRQTASLVSVLDGDIEIADSLVWCSVTVKSILNTKRYREIFKCY